MSVVMMIDFMDAKVRRQLGWIGKADLCQGDEQRWREQAKREWDKYTFGCYGCWVTDDDGGLSYVPEEEYTEELWNEQKKAAGRAMASHR